MSNICIKTEFLDNVRINKIELVHKDVLKESETIKKIISML